MCSEVLAVVGEEKEPGDKTGEVRGVVGNGIKGVEG